MVYAFAVKVKGSRSFSITEVEVPACWAASLIGIAESPLPSPGFSSHDSTASQATIERSGGLDLPPVGDRFSPRCCGG